jgi:hypothetical protein
MLACSWEGPAGGQTLPAAIQNWLGVGTCRYAIGQPAASAFALRAYAVGFAYVLEVLISTVEQVRALKGGAMPTRQLYHTG